MQKAIRKSKTDVQNSIVQEPPALIKKLPSNYPVFLENLKKQIQAAQIKAGLAVNRELMILYWNIGRLITEQQNQEGWGSKVIERLSKDLQNDLKAKGFSVRNIKRMKAYYAEYPKVPQAVALFQGIENIDENGFPDAKQEMPQLVAQLAQISLEIPWGHNVLLIEKIKEPEKRLWYMQQTIQNGWSRSILSLQIESNLYARQGKATTNFNKTMPEPQSDLALQILKDPYNFDFLTIADDAHEKEIEKELVKHVTNFLLELGAGFSYVGRQYNLKVGDQNYYIDLLFYHLKLRSYVVIELKNGSFKPEYAGKLNFYLSVVDDQIKHPSDNPSIGLLLCKDKDKLVAEYSLKDMGKPIGVSEYKIVESIPDDLKTSLPTIEELEEELSQKSK